MAPQTPIEEAITSSNTASHCPIDERRGRTNPGRPLPAARRQASNVYWSDIGRAIPLASPPPDPARLIPALVAESGQIPWQSQFAAAPRGFLPEPPAV